MADVAGNGDERPGGTTGSGDAGRGDGPIEGQVLLLAATKASVAPGRLPALVARAAADLRDRREAYRRTRERVVDGDTADVDADAYLVPTGHWREVGERLGLGARAADAVRRAHEEQLLRYGSETGRREEFEAALEIREAVVVGR